MPEDPAVVGRVADRGADVAAGLQRRQPGGQRRGRPARRAAGRARQVPGVVGGAVDGVEALPVGQQEGHVGLAVDDGARAQQTLDRQGICRRDVVAEFGHAPGGRHAGHVVGFLDRHGQAVQRPPDLAARERRVGLPGPPPRGFEVGRDDGVEGGVVALAAPQVEFQQLDAAHLAPPDRRGQPPRRPERQIIHVRYVPHSRYILSCLQNC